MQIVGNSFEELDLIFSSFQLTTHVKNYICTLKMWRKESDTSLIHSNLFLDHVEFLRIYQSVVSILI